MRLEASIYAQQGLEQHLLKELKTRFSLSPDPHKTLPLFTIETDLETLLSITYLSQMATRVTLPVHTGSLDSLTDITVSDTPALERLENNTYRVTADRNGDHTFTSVDVEQRVGGQLNKHGYDTVDLTAPENIVYVRVNPDAYHIGLDLTGRDLSQRQYKVFSSNDGINATLGYAFVQACQIEPGDRVVNPFSRDGVIPIETALRHKGKSVNHYSRDFKFDTLDLIDFFEMEEALDRTDQDLQEDETDIHCYDRDFRSLKAQKKNAKIAGVEDHMTFSRFEPEYIDLKFDDFQVDLIYGRPPVPTRQFPREKVETVYHDLFRYGKYVLRETGRMVFLVRDDDLLLEMANKFTLKETGRETLQYNHLTFDAITLEREHPEALEATHL